MDRVVLGPWQGSSSGGHLGEVQQGGWWHKHYKGAPGNISVPPHHGNWEDPKGRGW